MSLIKDHNGEEVEITEVWGSRDDIQFDGVYINKDEELSEETIEYIDQNHHEVLYEEWLNFKIQQGDFTHDSLKEK